MCDIIKEQIRINKILAFAADTRLDNTPVTLEGLTQVCIAALQICYEGQCPEECAEARARAFAAWHLARSGATISHSPGCDSDGRYAAARR